jgi:hypothetical protein
MRSPLSAILFLALLALVATAPALLGNRSLGPEFLLDADPLYAQRDAPRGPAVFDPTRYYYDLPRDVAAGAGIRQGRIDLWNPRVGLGMPLWGEGGALFFPPKIVFYLWPSRRALDLVVALRLLIAGVGAFLLARRRGLAPLPALAAGSLFELSGAIASTLQLGVMAPACMLPWVLLGAQVIAQRRTPAAAAGAGLALALTLGSGHPMLVVVVCAGFGAAVLGHVIAVWRTPREAVRIGALALLAVALGFAVAAPAVLPVLEAQGAARLYKSTGMYTLQLRWFLAQTAAALPIAIFAPATLDALRQPLSLGFPYVLLTPAIGLFALVFGVAGLLRRGLDPALLAVALLGAGLSLVPPVLGLLRTLPLLEYVYPMYAWSLVTLPLTQAAGRGVALLSARSGRSTLLAALAIVLAGASSLLSVHNVFPGSLLGFPARDAFLATLSEPFGALRLLLPLILVALAVVVLALGAGTRYARRCAVAGTLLASLELLISVAPVTWFPDSAVLGSTPSPALRFLQHHLAGGQYRMLAVPHTIGTPATPSLFDLADLRGASAMPVERYVRYLEAITPAAGWYVWQVPGNVVRHPLLDLAGVRYIVRPRSADGEPEPFLAGDGALRLVYSDARVAIYENSAALPRARIVHGALPVRDREEALHVWWSPAPPRLMPRLPASRTGSSSNRARTVDDGGAPAQGPASGEEVQIVPGDDPDEVELRANLTQLGWVVLADAFYPGWSTAIDGVPARIHPVDLGLRGVLVQAGAHRIVFRYEPRGFRVGLALAALGLAVSGWLIARGLWSASAHTAERSGRIAA